MRFAKFNNAIVFAVLTIYCLTAAAVEDVELKVYANGQELTSISGIVSQYPTPPTTTQLESIASDMQNARITVHDHDTIQLIVMRTTGSGAPEDVTSSTSIVYSPSDPWLMKVSPTGLVTVEPTPGFENTSQQVKDNSRGNARVTIMYATSDGQKRGGTAIFFNVLP